MSERIRRPETERVEPRRGLVNLVRETSGAAGQGDDVVSRSIGIGYRIVEEYLQQSRSVAAAMSPAAGQGDAGNVVAALTSRMARATADLFDIWFQVLSATSVARAGDPSPNAGNGATNGAGGPAPAASSGPSHPENNGEKSGDGFAANAAFAGHDNYQPARTGIEVEVASARPARVAVDLRPGAGASALVVHSLRSNDDSLPRIADVSIEGATSGSPVVVRVGVPADQPAGIYSGMIIDQATSLPVGTVSVILSANGRPG